MHLRALRTFVLCAFLLAAGRPMAVRAQEAPQDVPQDTAQGAPQPPAQERVAEPAQETSRDNAQDAAGDPPAGTPGREVAGLAVQYVGRPYVWGGNTPAGFDCSGFVQWVYGRFGRVLPHSEIGQLWSGAQVGAADLEPGDVLVFANTYKRGPSHSGIYLGGGSFIHAVDERHGVMVSSLWDSYWGPRLVGASRPLI